MNLEYQVLDHSAINGFEAVETIESRRSPSRINRSFAPAVLDRSDSNRHGTVVLGLDGSVLDANACARAISARADGLQVDREGLRALRSSDDETLQHLIAGALSCNGHRVTMSLPRLWGGRPYFIVINPLLFGEHLIAGDAVAARVTIVDPDRVPEPTPPWLKLLFGLTGAESRLALQLFAGSTVMESAVALGISQATARVHLAHIFRKTGTARQAELVRLLMSYPWEQLASSEREAAPAL
ncbi:MAG TPA: hypothetical protein VGI20_05235 [Rhizomicrobium sp.]|jgi:DNA-binding CsgD family transcriptional regulator